MMPANAMCLSGVCISLYGVIFIGSTTAFSAMVSAAIVFQQTSCVIPQAILLWRGRDKVLPPHYFNLGRLGAPVNFIAVTWVAFLDILYCFPTALPVTPQNMSWVSVVSAGLIGFVIALWFATKRGTFVGPAVDFELIKARREQAIGGEIEGVGIDGQISNTVSMEGVGKDTKGFK